MRTANSMMTALNSDKGPTDPEERAYGKGGASSATCIRILEKKMKTTIVYIIVCYRCITVYDRCFRHVELSFRDLH